MTDNDGRTDPGVDHRLEDLVTRGLAQTGELIPTTEQEVAHAEAFGVKQVGDLPARLREYRAAAGEVAPVIPIDRARRTPSRPLVWASHGIASLVGAAAAFGLAWWYGGRAPNVRPNLAADPTRESPASGGHTPARAEPAAVVVDEGCAAHCCAGLDCKTTADKPKECASGRRCVRCMDNDASGERFRVRTGRIAPTPALVRLLEGTPDKILELCFRVTALTSGDFVCTSAQARGDLDESWVSLPLVVSGVDLLTGLTVQLRWHGEVEPIGEWSSPIQTNTAVFCSGLSIKPKQSDGELLGTFSVFLDETYYVELARGSEPNVLVEGLRAFRLEGAMPKLFETQAEGEQRFAVAIGPLGKDAAQRTRWALLERGGQPQVVVGLDYRGDPKALK